MSEQIEEDLEVVSRALRKRFNEETVKKAVELLKWLLQKYDVLLGVGGTLSNYIYVANVLLPISTAELDAQAIRCVASRLGLKMSLTPWRTTLNEHIPVDVYLLVV